MKRKIKSYNDLEREEQLLEELLETQKKLVQLDIQVLKQQLKPATAALQFFSKITTVDKSNLLLNEGANSIIDLVLKRGLLARSGWITKLLIPFFVKNYSSHLISDNKDGIMQKLFSIIGGKNGKSKTAESST